MKIDKTGKATGFRAGLNRMANSFERKVTTGAVVVGGVVGGAMAALPAAYDLDAAATTLAGYVADAAGLGVGVFVAFRAASIIPAAFKKLLH